MAGTDLENPRAQGVPLPTELATKIIAIVEDGHHSKHHQRGPSPLADIALVSHTWNAVCRLHMFHTVTLYSDTVYSRLSFIHFQAPHLSQYIRELYFQPSAAERIASKAEWFPACFARFDNLDKIRFENCCKGPLSAASLAAFAAPQRLRKLDIYGWKFAGVYDFLSMLPPTLEELRLDEVKFDSSQRNAARRDLELKAPRIPGVRLDALRTIELHRGQHSILATPHLIECPNLARLFVICSSTTQVQLPPWIPTSLPELVLSVGHGSIIPDFGTDLQPSSVTIYPSCGHGSEYLNHFTCARECIEGLPYPHAIQTLTILIEFEHFWGPLEESFPALSDYEMLSQLVCHLRESEQGSCLQSIVLVIKISTSPIPGKRPYDGHQVRELAKLEKGFARLVEANVLTADLTLESEDSEPYMRCKIRRV
ncbi:hypothetical protein AB1N83_013341 [Pleurotus pulmonarius]